MSKVILLNNNILGESFFEEKYLDKNQDEFYFRNQQVEKKNGDL